MAETDNREPSDLDPVISDAVRDEMTRRNHAMHQLHLWFGRRPNVMARIATFLALTNGADSDSELIQALSQPEPLPLVLTLARKRIEEVLFKTTSGSSSSHNLDGVIPLVLDPFAGGGSIPFEAIRLGCEVSAGELNPLGAAILRGTVDYPARWGSPSVDVGSGRPWRGLSEEFAYWFQALRAEVRTRWETLYPKGGLTHFLWLRQVNCQNPECGVLVPLSEEVPLDVASNGSTQVLQAAWGKDRPYFQIVESDRRPHRTRGTSCPRCGSAISRDALAAQKPIANEATLAAIAHREPKQTIWEIAESGSQAEDICWKLSPSLQSRLDELMGSDVGCATRQALPSHAASEMIRQGATTFSELFSPRQLLAALELLDAMLSVQSQMRNEGMAEQHTEAVSTYFAFGLGYLIQHNCVLTSWNPRLRRSMGAFALQAYHFQRDFIEVDPTLLLDRWFENVKFALADLVQLKSPATVFEASAQNIPFEDNRFDAVVTDPPYFDNISYADLSDFFWVWESRLVAPKTSNLFAPKSADFGVTASSVRLASVEQYEDGLRDSFRECFRVLKPARFFCMILTAKLRAHFDAYVALSEAAGFELVNIRRIATSRRIREEIEGEASEATYLVYLRKPASPAEHQGLAADAEVLLQLVDQDRPVMYEAVAQLLVEQLDPIDIERIVPDGSKGTVIERIQEVLAECNPKDLLRNQLGTATIRRLAKDKGLISDEDRETDPLDALLLHFGFRIPNPGSMRGVRQVIDLLHRNASKLQQTSELDQIIGTFTEGAMLVEQMIKRGVYGWARIAFRENAEQSLKKILVDAGKPDADLSRLSFGHYLDLFERLPDTISQSDFANRVNQKFGRTHIYLPGRPKGNSLMDRLRKVVSARNKVAHNKEDLVALRGELSTVLESAGELVRELAAVHAIPRIGVVFEQVQDMWGRLTYRIRLDDGTVFEGTFSTELKLGDEYFFFGSEVNPKPVDPLLIRVEDIGRIP